MTYLLEALVIQLLVPVVVVAVAYATGKLAARRLGIPEFRVLKAGAPGTHLKRFSVRSASVFGAFLTCFVLAFLAARRGVVQETTMIVDVMDGPARTAGVKDGDRVLALDGKPYDTWDAFRAEIQASQGSRTLTLERNGARVSLDVTPRDGRVGLVHRTNRHEPTVVQAATDAVATAFWPLRQFVPGPREDRPAITPLRHVAPRVSDQRGPVGIVREVEASTVDEVWSALRLSALFAGYTWLAVLAFHAFDALLLRIRRSNAREGDSAT